MKPTKESVGYKAIVESALRRGINVVGMDSVFAKHVEQRTGKEGEDALYGRDAAMNQFAFETIARTQAEQATDFIVFTGSAHASTQEFDDKPAIAGLSERLGIKSVDRQDLAKKTK